MNFNEYQEAALKTAIYEHPAYPVVSLMVEAAELADLYVKPLLRGDPTPYRRDEVVSEAGDVLWNLATLLAYDDITLQEVAEYNIKKLRDRQARDTLTGKGGNR